MRTPLSYGANYRQFVVPTSHKSWSVWTPKELAQACITCWSFSVFSYWLQQVCNCHNSTNANPVRLDTSTPSFWRTDIECHMNWMLHSNTRDWKIREWCPKTWPTNETNYLTTQLAQDPTNSPPSYLTTQLPHNPTTSLPNYLTTQLPHFLITSQLNYLTT